MKKYLAILCVLTLALTSCNTKETTDQADSQAAQKAEQVVEETKAEMAAETDALDKADAEAQDAIEQMNAEADAAEAETIAEEESEYIAFEKNMTDLFKEKGITDIMVAPYSKGIDVIFHVDNKDMTKDQFVSIAKEVVTELKNNFDYIDKELPIGCSLEYQPDPNQDTEILITEDIK
ncbi:DUF6981 domain-containing protein [Fusobacterium sp.]|uniref:DUF6981 domain-containing protein n=1 Tax=Fusobacterium sp. TaxID=68766 RepID=UPI00396CFDB0